MERRTAVSSWATRARARAGARVRARAGRRRSPPGTTIVLALVLALLGAGCSHPSATRPTLRYVALGDSFASGEGNPPFLAGTDVTTGSGRDTCHRSTSAYPLKLTVRANLVVVFRACSGARIEDVTTTARFAAEPPQVRWVGPTTDLVTVTIGGNDAGGMFSVAQCLLGPVDCSTVDPATDARIAALAQSLPPVYAELRRRAPNARIYVVDYPDIFPTEAQARVETCSGLRILGHGLTASEMGWLHDHLETLDRVIDGAAARAGVRHVHTAGAFAGHELCSPRPWVNGLQVLDHEYSFHPDAAGQAAMASIVSAAVDG